MDNCSICRRKSFLVKLCKCHGYYCINHKDNHVCTFDYISNGRPITIPKIIPVYNVYR